MASCGTRGAYSNGCRCDACKAVHSVYMKNWHASRTPKSKRGTADRRFFKLYGITLNERDEMLKQQGGVCDICKTSKFGRSGPVLDHDHVTKKNRAVLCSSCNVGIGHFRENIKILAAAIVYLHIHKDLK